MAKFDFAVEDGSALGNPALGRYFIFLDSNNSDRLTLRDSSGTDTVYTAGVIPTVLDDLLDVDISLPSSGQMLVYNGSDAEWENQDAPVFGTALNTFTNDALVTNTNAGANLDVINANTIDLDIGNYLLVISANISYDATNSDGIVNFTFDGSPISSTTGNNEIYRLEFKEAGGNNPPGAGTNQKDTLSIIRPVTVSVAGTKNVTLSIIPEAGGVEVNMWNTSIIIFRLS